VSVVAAPVPSRATAWLAPLDAVQDRVAQHRTPALRRLEGLDQGSTARLAAWSASGCRAVRDGEHGRPSSSGINAAASSFEPSRARAGAENAAAVPRAIGCSATSSIGCPT
jgi:hypothetical protein